MNSSSREAWKTSVLTQNLQQAQQQAQQVVGISTARASAGTQDHIGN
jgi:hypothetical protein